MKNRTALITGGGGLLGPQHGIALASEGINIVLVDKKEIKLKRAKNRILNEYPYLDKYIQLKVNLHLLGTLLKNVPYDIS